MRCIIQEFCREKEFVNKILLGMVMGAKGMYYFLYIADNAFVKLIRLIQCRNERGHLKTQKEVDKKKTAFLCCIVMSWTTELGGIRAAFKLS